MKIPFLSRRLAAAASLAITGFLPIPSADASSIIVNWGGSYLSADRSTGAAGTAITGGFLYNYSLTEKKSPAHTDYAGTSSTFYGAVQTSTQTGTPGGGQLRVNKHDGVNNRIHIQSANGSPTNQANVQGFLFWQKQDFLAGFADQSTIKLSDLGDMSVNVPLARGDTEIRFAVMNDNVWYLSEVSLKGYKAGVPLGEFVLSDPASVNWGIWDVQSTPGEMLEAAPLVFDISGDTLSNITAVGFYFNSSYSASNAAILDFDSFSVTSIPEASHMALLGLSSLLFIGNLWKSGFSMKP